MDCFFFRSLLFVVPNESGDNCHPASTQSQKFSGEITNGCLL
jgi:hypothetical protein